MRKWSFKFFDYDLNVATPLKYDVDEWKSFGISFGREEKTSILKSYSAQFTFINEDADYLKNIVKNRNFSARIGLNVYLEGNLYYQCRLELFECKIEYNTFQCPVYVGGFFALLDNEWNVKRTISNRIVIPEHVENGVKYLSASIPDNDFENIRFSGGGYKYEKLLNINAEKIELSKGSQVSIWNDRYQCTGKANFLPIVNNSGDNQLKYFQDTQEATILNNNSEITMKNMFFLSQKRINSGSIEINGSFGQVEWEQGNQNFPQGIDREYQCKAKIIFYLLVYDNWTQDESATWRPAEHSLIAINNIGVAEIASKELDLTGAFYMNDEGKNVMVFFQNGGHYPSTANTEFHFENITFDTSWLKNYSGGHGGYYLGLCASIEVQYLETYFGVNQWTTLALTHNLYAYDSDVKIFMRYNDFHINQSARKICGIRPSVLFKKMVESINGKATPRYDAEGNSLGNYDGDYKLNFDLSALESADSTLTLFSDKMAKGDLELFEAGMMTSLEELCKFIYVNMGLKMCCIYDRLTDTYNISFKSMTDLYTQDEVCELDGKTTRVSISATADEIYSHIKVGYNNLEEAIMGQKEYNALSTFKTEHKERPELAMELFSLYKGGNFDVETIVYSMQGNEDTDVNSDNIFILEVNRIGGRFGNVSKLYPVQYGNINKGLNVGISPKRLLKLHKNEMVSIRQLNFETTTRDADFEYLSIKENTDEDTIGVPKLYSPFTLQVKSAGLIDVLNKIESNPFGLITFKIGGRKYSGYLANVTECVSINPMNEQESEFLLFSKQIPF